MLSQSPPQNYQICSTFLLRILLCDHYLWSQYSQLQPEIVSPIKHHIINYFKLNLLFKELNYIQFTFILLQRLTAFVDMPLLNITEVLLPQVSFFQMPSSFSYYRIQLVRGKHIPGNLSKQHALEVAHYCIQQNLECDSHLL
jgi:hypothetical protein